MSKVSIGRGIRKYSKKGFVAIIIRAVLA